ncbi:MAG: VWA domain-containing protein [Polyangiaceae bacterium]|nr:VWA domain-containing protein [Polyangiaceae bacterium]
MTLGLMGLGALYPYFARRDVWTEVTWQEPRAFFLLLVVPGVWLMSTVLSDRMRPRLRLGTVLPLAVGPRGIRAWLRDLPGSARAAALTFMIVALARPVTLLSDQKSDDKGIDIVVVLDVSMSMAAVLDADPRVLPGAPHPTPGKRLTRLDTAKLVIDDFVSRRHSDRIGVVVFGRSAYVLSPPTLDYHLLGQLVSRVQLGVVDGYGTAIGDAVGTAVARIRKSDAASKVIVLLTDGDSNAGQLAPEYAADLAAKAGAKVYTIQIGNGEEVDVFEGTDPFGQPVYRKHRFPVNPELLKAIAQKTGAESYVATDAAALVGSMHAVLDALEKTRFEASISSFEDLFPLFLIPGAFLIALDAFLRAVLLRRFP